MKSIGLCMIVRNEAPVIRRCLESLLPLIDYVLIVDTGSTDATRIVVRDFLSEKNIPGEVVDESWQNFAYNRTFALRKLREKREIDYGLMVDADQIMVYEPDFAAQRFKETLREDLYDIRLRTGSIEYLVPHLSSNRIDVAYKGVLHEYRECPDDCTRGIASGFYIQEMQDSARSTNVRKFQDDAETLLHALRNESDPFLVSRYKFYLAQSFRDSGDSESALKHYLERAELGFWDQEVFISLYNAAQMKEALKHPETEVIETYLRAHRTCPLRAEALHGAARFCRSPDGTIRVMGSPGRYCICATRTRGCLSKPGYINTACATNCRFLPIGSATMPKVSTSACPCSRMVRSRKISARGGRRPIRHRDALLQGNAGQARKVPSQCQASNGRGRPYRRR
jgi:Glycosyl transferase family 2